jgi:stage IV sporulation protein FB
VQPSRSQANDRRIPGCVGSLQILGVPVRFHFTFWLIVVWLIVFGARGKQSAAAMTLYITAIFGSVLLHELGHALAARHYGIRTLEIVMLPIGGLARVERAPKPREELWVALAGPAVNLLIAGLIFAWLAASGQPLAPENWMEANDRTLLPMIAAANLLLAGFNLLPAFPMDGGRILRSLLSRFRPEHEATRTAARVGMGMAALMGLYGLLASNFFLVFIAFFVYVGAVQESLASQQQVLIRGERVRSAMITEFRTLNHGDTIRDAAAALLSTTQQDFPVQSGSQVTGVLTRTALLRAMASEGPDAYVAGAMDRDFARLTPDMDLADAVPLLAGKNVALVFEGERLAGLLTAENLSEFLVLREIRHARERTAPEDQ